MQISKTIPYTREELNKIIKKIKGNVELVFDEKKLTEDEHEIINQYYSIKTLDYLSFEEEFLEVVREFKAKIIRGNESRLVMSSKDALEFVNKLIDKLKLYDFWIVNDEKIVCLYHEHEICVINRK